MSDQGAWVRFYRLDKRWLHFWYAYSAKETHFLVRPIFAAFSLFAPGRLFVSKDAGLAATNTSRSGIRWAIARGTAAAVASLATAGLEPPTPVAFTAATTIGVVALRTVVFAAICYDRRRIRKDSGIAIDQYLHDFARYPNTEPGAGRQLAEEFLKVAQQHVGLASDPKLYGYYSALGAKRIPTTEMFTISTAPAEPPTPNRPLSDSEGTEEAKQAKRPYSKEPPHGGATFSDRQDAAAKAGKPSRLRRGR